MRIYTHSKFVHDIIIFVDKYCRGKIKPKMSKNLTPESNDIIFYSSPKGDVRVEVFFQEETFWLSQNKMAALFGVDVRTVNEHLQNIYLKLKN